jgi:Rrf2 family iron-sulfur cluster assembly transcriptional regulator
MISQSGRQALAAVQVLAQHNGRRFLTVRQISQRIGASPHTLARVVLRLTAAGLTDTLRGPGGGVRLAKAAQQITLLEVVQAVDGPRVFERCVVGLGPCNEVHPCPLHPLWSQCCQQLRHLLAQTTLKDLLAPQTSINKPSEK